MGDWPSTLFVPGLTVVTSAGPSSGLGQQLMSLGKFGTVSTGWPTANQGVFLPVYLEQAFQPQQVAWENGATLVGNVDVGIYDSLGNRLGNIGSTAVAGASVAQTAAITTTPAVLQPGVYYWAMSASSISTLVRGSAQGKVWLEIAGVQQMVSAGPPLPATATLVIPSMVFTPWIAIAGVATI